jgi:hypothetical protein
VGKNIQIYWRRSKGGSEFGVAVDRITSQVMIDGVVVEYPRAVAHLFPGGAIQVWVIPEKGVHKAISGVDRDFIQMTATLWLFYVAELGVAVAFPSLGFRREGVIDRVGDSEEMFSSIQDFLKQEDKKRGNSENETE